AETFADGVHAAEALKQWPKIRRADAEHFHVQIFRAQPQQVVAHRATDDERAAANIAYCTGDVDREVWKERARLLSHQCVTRRPHFCPTRSAFAGATTLSTDSHQALRSG